MPLLAVGPDGNFLVNDGSGSPLVLLPLPTASTMTNQMLTLDRDQGAKTEKMPSFTLPALSSHVSASRGALWSILMNFSIRSFRGMMCGLCEGEMDKNSQDSAVSELAWQLRARWQSRHPRSVGKNYASNAGNLEGNSFTLFNLPCKRWKVRYKSIIRISMNRVQCTKE